MENREELEAQQQKLFEMSRMYNLGNEEPLKSTENETKRNIFLPIDKEEGKRREEKDEEEEEEEGRRREENEEKKEKKEGEEEGGEGGKEVRKEEDI